MDTEARCRGDQISACTSAIANGVLSDLDSGGTCQQLQYDIYDALCTLNFYTPGNDYCCCPLGDKEAYCCRFHYTHGYYRCDAEQDTYSLPLLVDPATSEDNGDISLFGLFYSSQTMTIVISVIVPIIILILIITIAVKCSRGRQAMYQNNNCCYADSPASERNAKTSSTAADTAEVPLSTEPSAPPEEDLTLLPSSETPLPCTAPSSELPHLPPYYDRIHSVPEDIHISPNVEHGIHHGYYRADSDSQAMRHPLTSISEAPPAYDEHQNDPCYHPEMNGPNMRGDEPDALPMNTRQSSWY